MHIGNFTAPDRLPAPSNLPSGDTANIGPTTYRNTGTSWVPQTPTLTALTGGSEGYVGAVGAENFGMNWIRRPINWDAVSGSVPGIDRLNDAGPVSSYAGTEGAGWVRVFWSFDTFPGGGAGVFQPNSTTMTPAASGDIPLRIVDLRYVIRFWHNLGKKVLLVLDYQPLPDVAHTQRYADRLQQFLLRLAEDGLTYLDALEFCNEPYNALSAYPGGASAGLAKLAEAQRVTFIIAKSISSRTIVTSASFQGGETWGPEALMTASASGISTVGPVTIGNGAGTRGEQFFDVIAYHPYTSFSLLSEVTPALTSSLIEQTIRERSTWIKTAISNRRAATDGGSAWWAGRPDPEAWATEVNVCPHGGNPTSNGEFRFQFYSLSQRRRLMEAVVNGCLQAKYAKTFPYAPDHEFGVGPDDPRTGSTFSATPSNCMRWTAASPLSIFDGDSVYTSGGNMPYPMRGVASGASASGKAFTLDGVPGYLPSYMVATRAVLGGWAQTWPEIQSAVTGYLETGWSADNYPQLRRDHGAVQRLINGKMAPI